MSYMPILIACWALVVTGPSGQSYSTDQRLCYRIDTHSSSTYPTYQKCRDAGEWYAQTRYVQALMMVADMRQPGQMLGVRVRCVGGGA